LDIGGDREAVLPATEDCGSRVLWAEPSQSFPSHAPVHPTHLLACRFRSELVICRTRIPPGLFAATAPFSRGRPVKNAAQLPSPHFSQTVAELATIRDTDWTCPPRPETSGKSCRLRLRTLCHLPSPVCEKSGLGPVPPVSLRLSTSKTACSAVSPPSHAENRARAPGRGMASGACARPHYPLRTWARWSPPVGSSCPMVGAPRPGEAVLKKHHLTGCRPCTR